MKTVRELELEVELEISTLQIDQLQEELEHYLLECDRLQEREVEYSAASSQSPARELLAESRANDSGYFESGFYATGKYLPARISQLKQALESSKKEKAMLERQVSERERDKKRGEILQIQVEQLTKDLVDGTKKQSKALVDLDQLRDAYAEKLASEQELVELLNELREKLTLASRYFFDLQKEHPEVLLPFESR